MTTEHIHRCMVAVEHGRDEACRCVCGKIRWMVERNDWHEPAGNELTDAQRDVWFARGNDAIWGKGQWVRCHTCPHDAEGREVYHHKDAHQ